MDATDVVTCFLRHEGAVLLRRHAGNAGGDGETGDGSRDGAWDAVSAPAGGDREAAAREAVARAVGREDGDATATLRRRGEPVEAGEERREQPRRHPFLFDCDERPSATGDGGAADREWVSPPEIRRRETVPGLWTAYDRVRPRVATVRDDRERGSAALSACALAVLRDEAATGASGDWDAAADVARDLLAARPAMAVVTNRVNRAMDAASEERTPAAVAAAARRELERALRVDERAATEAADRLPDRLATLSRSGTVLAAIREANPEAVLVAESRPGREGVDVAATLAEEAGGAGAGDEGTTAPAVTLTTDAALADRLAAWKAEALVVGADRILPDGRVVNKVGTRGAALAAPPECPCYVVAASDKVAVDAVVDREERPAGEVYDGPAPVAVANPTFDVTPADAVDAVLTERGALDADGIAATAERHRSRAEWA